MENIKEDLCFSCKNKSDIREVLSRLELIHDRLGTIMRNLSLIHI